MNRHLQGVLWWMLVWWHLSEEQQIGIVCHTTFLGRCTFGYQAAALRYFERPLDRLTDKALALLGGFQPLAESLGSLAGTAGRLAWCA